jgi:hypothetical protein
VARIALPPQQLGDGTQLKLKVLNVSKKDLLRDLQRAPEFDQSALFKKVYEEEYGVFGGAPFGRPARRLRVRASPVRTSSCWRRSRTWQPAAHAPFLTAASSDMLNLESFAQIDAPRDMGKVFDTTEYAKWKPSARRRTRVRGAHAAAHPHARAVRQGHRSRSRPSRTRSTSTGRTTASISGATRRGPSALE